MLSYFATFCFGLALGILLTVAVIRNNRAKAKSTIDKL